MREDIRRGSGGRPGVVSLFWFLSPPRNQCVEGNALHHLLSLTLRPPTQGQLLFWASPQERGAAAGVDAASRPSTRRCDSPLQCYGDYRPHTLGGSRVVT